MKKEIKITEFKEHNLLKALSTRDCLNKYLPLVKKHTVLPETYMLLEDFKKYLDSYPDKDEINFKTFGTWFSSAHSSYKEDKLKFFLAVIDNIDSADEDEVDDLLHHFSRLDVATRIRATSERYINGSISDLSAELRKLLDEHTTNEAMYTTKDTEDSLFLPATAEHVVGALLAKGSGFKWSLRLLNEAFGPMHLGDFGCIMARPNGGKTTLLVQEILNFLLQMPDGSKSIIFNNEEKGEKIQAYAYKHLLKQPLGRIALNPGKGTKDFNAKLGDRKFYVKDTNLTVWAAEKIIERVKPSIVGFNLLGKLLGFGKDASELENLTKLYRWGRDIGKRYNCIVLATHQADTSAEGQKWMTQQQMFGVKTEAQGELDVLIGVGRPHDGTALNTRYLSSCKNKQPDSLGMDPSLREGPLGEVEFDGDTATFKDK